MHFKVFAASLWMLCAAANAQLEPPLSLPLENEPWLGDLDGMTERRRIRVLVPYNRILYFVDLQGQQRGMSYDFMLAFEEQLNKKLKRGRLRIHFVFVPAPRDELLKWLITGRGDVVAANLTITPPRLQQVDFTIPLARDVRGLIVTGLDAPPLQSLDDLAGKQVFVQRSSSYYDSLVALNAQFTQRKLPKMQLLDAPGHFETEDILEMANAGMVKIVVADDYLANLW